MLRRLDGDHKGALLRFLFEADLIDKDRIVIDLNGADLIGADLREAKYTKNAKVISDTTWPDGFDPDAAGAIRVN